MFAQDEVIWDAVDCEVRSGVIAVVKGMLEVVCDEIAGLEQQVYVIRCSAFHAVRGRDPGRVLWRGPVQLGDDLAAQLFNCRLDSLVDVAPLCRGILVIVIGLGCIVCGREDAAVRVRPIRAVVVVRREDDAVGAKVREEGGCERDQSRLGCDGAIARTSSALCKACHSGDSC